MQADRRAEWGSHLVGVRTGQGHDLLLHLARHRRSANRSMSDIHELVQILLVEDNRGGVRLTRGVLKEAKFCNKVAVVGNGEVPLAYLRQEGEYSDAIRPPLILLALNCPPMDGRELPAAIKKD